MDGTGSARGGRAEVGTSRRARVARNRERTIRSASSSSTTVTGVAWASAAAMLVFAAAAQLYGNGLIAARFPDRPRPRDLLFELLPQVDVLRYSGDITIFVGLLVLLVYGLALKRRDVPAMMAVFGIFYTLRAAIMVLTPFAIAHGDAPYHAVLPITQNGNFPSGHAGALLLCVLLVERGEGLLRPVMLGLGILGWVSLLLSHSHYSIDIVGGWLLAYFVWREWVHGTLFRAWRRLTGASSSR